MELGQAPLRCVRETDMTDKTYSDREIDAKNGAIIEKIGDLQNVLELKMTTFENDTRNSLSRIEVQVGFTNGKVRKLILALIFLAGVIVGLGILDARVITPLLGI